MNRFQVAVLAVIAASLGSFSIAEEDSRQPQGIDLAKGRQFWSFQPLNSVQPPKVADESWIRTPVDRFILADLEKNALEPNPEASRRTLLRRAVFGLWGLPAEPSEIEAYLSNEAPGAYENLVDRLLDGPHYGERWARHWLDLARFAESNGYAFDKDRGGAYHFRDFVIKALNEDMPYDRFVRLQIAGDQIEPENYMAQAATGFLAAGPFTSQQTQKERERSRYEQLDDIVHTMGTSMLGLTIGCARCHDHKYDPVPISDYYRLVSCFSETGFQDHAHDPNPAKTKNEKQKFDLAHEKLVVSRTKFEQEILPTRLAEWLATRKKPQETETLSPWSHIGPFGATDFKKAYNETFPPEKSVNLSETYEDRKWVARPEWKDGTIHNTLKGDNSANYLFRTIEVSSARSLPVSFGRDDAIKVWLNSESVLAKETQGGVAKDQDKLTLELKAGSNQLLVKIINGGGGSGFYFSTSPEVPENINSILALAPEVRSDKQKQEVLKWYSPRDPDWTKLNHSVDEHAKTAPKPALINIYAARKGGATYNFGADTRKVYFLERGESNSKQDLATPAFLRVLQVENVTEEHWLKGPEKHPPRVALAHWMTDADKGAGHLLARVIVNRLWQHHLGLGIVRTPSDFGSQGMPPTHPALLDYLAGELIRNGWRLKPLHKMIMMSSVYRQQGNLNQMAMKIDPENKLWWRRGATRLEAEVIRDSLLAVSGTLDKRMFDKGSVDQRETRRSIYLTVKRSNLIPILQLFDAPDAMQGIGQRIATTVPPQALAMMNSSYVREIAEKFATRIRSDESASIPEIIQRAYQHALSRLPTTAEEQQMSAFIKGQAESYGDSPQAMDTAIADFCQTVICLNEFIFVD
ncbi:MAG TPA: hypothetical protein DIV39_11630 [Verrucomicrobiales bacterium]|nr:hypothetical protein [Verrucomicrobiales bacterium]